MKITVLGAGSWGTALAMTAEKNGHLVSLWTHDSEEAKTMDEGRKCKNLPEIRIPDSIRILSSLEEAVKGAELLLFAIPSIYTREMALRVKPSVRKEQILLTVSKGIEEKTLDTMSDILEEVFPENRVAVLSGPSHAEEVSRFIPTTIVCASKEEETAKIIQNAFLSDSFRVYTNKDIRGVEIGAALKNVIALAAGIADGLGYGDNTMAALITRGIAEISRLGIAMGCHRETFAGLSGIG